MQLSVNKGLNADITHPKGISFWKSHLPLKRVILSLNFSSLFIRFGICFPSWHYQIRSREVNSQTGLSF
jgi:hypothetical protein